MSKYVLISSQLQHSRVLQRSTQLFDSSVSAWSMSFLVTLLNFEVGAVCIHSQSAWILISYQLAHITLYRKAACCHGNLWPAWGAFRSSRSWDTWTYTVMNSWGGTGVARPITGGACAPPCPCLATPLRQCLFCWRRWRCPTAIPHWITRVCLGRSSCA